MLKESSTGKSRGFGFVTLDEDSAIEQLLDGREHTIDGRTITVRRASKKAADSGGMGGGGMGGGCMGSMGGGGGCGGPMGCGGGGSINPPPPVVVDGITERKVFLGGIDIHMTEAAVRAACSAHGEIEDVQMMNNPANTPGGRGFAFCTFNNAETATKLIAMGQMEIEGRTINIQNAQPRGTKRRNNNNNNNNNNNCGGMGGCCGGGCMGGCCGGCCGGGCGGGCGWQGGGGAFPPMRPMGGCGMGGCGMGGCGMGGCGMGGCGMGGCGMGGCGMGGGTGGGCMGGCGGPMCGGMGCCPGMGGGMGGGGMGGGCRVAWAAT